MPTGTGTGQEMRADLQAKLSEINATALRLEQARTNERKQIETEVQRADASRQGEEARRRARSSGHASPRARRGRGSPAPSRSALRVAVCARIPAAATVKEVQLYIRSEDSKQPWSESRVQPGQEAGEARFADKFSERPRTGARSRSARDSRTGASKNRVSRARRQVRALSRRVPRSSE